MTIYFYTHPHEDMLCREIEHFTYVERLIGLNAQPKDESAVLLLDEHQGSYLMDVKHRKLQKYTSYMECKANGYIFEQFNYSNYVPDIVQIKTSKDFRSGGELKPHYKKSVEESGGYPEKFMQIEHPHCKLHQRNIFHGVFMDVPGYKQGEIVTNKRLIAYNGIAVCGELAIYSWNIGHGDYLKDGIMNLLTIDTILFLLKEHPEVKYLVYSGWDDGTHVGPGLQQNKKEFLFQPAFMIKSDG